MILLSNGVKFTGLPVCRLLGSWGPAAFEEAGGITPWASAPNPSPLSLQVRKQWLDVVTESPQAIELPHFPLQLEPDLALVRRARKWWYRRLEEKPTAVVIHFFED